MNEKIEAVEQGLRYKVHIKGTPPDKMNLRERMDHYKVPGVSIAVINDGTVEWINQYGVVAVDSKEPVTDQSLFQAGSISKSITALGVMVLVKEGKLSLDCDVNDYLRSWKIAENEFTKKEKVTLRRLLSHSAGLTISGFPGYEAGSKIPTLIEILDGKPPANTKAVRVERVPGTKFSYSGGGTSVIQLIIEEVTKEPFDIWMSKHVLSELGMNSSTFQQPLPQSMATMAASGNLSNGKKVKGNWHIYPEMAAAGLWTTPRDLANAMIFIQKIYSKKWDTFLPYELVHEMLTPQITVPEETALGERSSGLGVFLIGAGQNLAFAHGGLDEGFIARFYGFAERGQGFIVMLNWMPVDVYGWDLIDEIMHSIADVYAWPNMPLREKNRIYVDPATYQQFVGTYYPVNADLTPYKIIKIDNTIAIVPKGMLPMNLYAESDNRYFMKESKQTVEFIKDEESKSPKLVIIFETGVKEMFLQRPSTTESA